MIYSITKNAKQIKWNLIKVFLKNESLIYSLKCQKNLLLEMCRWIKLFFMGNVVDGLLIDEYVNKSRIDEYLN